MSAALGIRMRHRLVQRDGAACFWCELLTIETGNFGQPSKAPETRTVDHVIPRSKGGSNHIDNLVLACLACNNGRADLPAEEWLAELDRRDRAKTLRSVVSVAREIMREQAEPSRLPRWPFIPCTVTL